METSKDKLLGKIGDNLRLVITISIFFLVVFPDTKLAGSILIAGYIIDYIIFQFREGGFNLRNLKWINISLLVGIGSYILPLAIVALSTQNLIIPPWQILAFKGSILVSMFAIVVMPAAILIMLCMLSGDKTLRQRFFS